MTSKFEILFLIRKTFIPAILLAGCLYFLYTGISTLDISALIPAFVFLGLSALILLYNLNSVYKVIVEDTGITKVFIFNRKREFISFNDIVESRLEFIQGAESDGGQITPGFYVCVFFLTMGRKFVLTPEHYENYNQLIKQISENRSQ